MIGWSDGPDRTHNLKRTGTENKMTTQDLNQSVLELIGSGLANTQAALSQSTGQEKRAIDNTLKRLKERGVIAYDKATKRWTLSQVSSQPSAPIADSVVGSEGQTAAPIAPTKEGNKTMTTENSSSNNTVTEIDEAIKQAKSGSSKPKADKAEGKRPRLSAEEKAAREQVRETERAEKRRLRDEARVAKQAEKAKATKPAHMSKVDKAASRLPSLVGTAQEIFDDITSNLGRDQVAALAQHLVHFNRVKATERALDQKVATGDSVRIIGGDSRFVGRTGTVTKAQRIRCYVEVEGAKKPVYLFTSDVEVIAQAAQASVG